MEDPLNNPASKIIWYENYGPVREYLDGESAGKSKTKADDMPAKGFSWLKEFEKSADTG